MTYTLIARKNGSLSSRRQRKFSSMEALQRAKIRWSKQGFNGRWIRIGDGELTRVEHEEQT